MLHLNIQGLRDESGWQAAHIALPRYDVSAMQERTLRHPVWIHFGAGNIFRAFLAVAQQSLLNAGLTDTGIVAAASHNFSAATEGYTPTTTSPFWCGCTPTAPVTGRSSAAWQAV